MLDVDLAVLYGVETWNLNKAVKRNKERFPADFLFQLTVEESRNLTFQIGMSSLKVWGGRRRPPYAFSEQGVAMLSSVLRGGRAARVNIAIMRAFVKQREIVSAHKDLVRRLDDLEKKYDSQFKTVFEEIRGFIASPEPPRRKIGFHLKRENF